MVARTDPRTSQRNLADGYIVTTLPIATWVEVTLPDGCNVVDAESTGYVVAIAATADDTIPTTAPAGAGSLLLTTFQLRAGQTRLFLWSLSGTGDTVHINCYEG